MPMENSEYFITGMRYRILRINSRCEWYSNRHAFEGKLMECVDLFDHESVGFRFVEQKDCPSEYNFYMAFCFYRAGAEQCP